MPNAAPMMDLAAPWGGFMLPTQLAADAAPKADAAQQAVEPRTAWPDQAASSPARAQSSEVGACSDAASQPALAMQAPHACPEPATSMPPDSWDAATAEALPPASIASRAPSSLHGSDGRSQALVSAAADDAPSVCTRVTNDPTGSKQASTAQDEAGSDPASAAQVALPKPKHTTASGSIDWDSLGFDFGPVEDGHCTADESASQQAAVDQGIGTAAVMHEGGSTPISDISKGADSAELAAWPSAHSDAMQTSSTPTDISLSCKAEPAHDSETAVAASDEDEWGFGDFEAAAASSLGAALATADADTVHKADQEDSWGAWDASEGAAASAEQPAQDSPTHQAGLSTQLGPAGSQGGALLEFDQWGRAYSALETQAASRCEAPAPPASASDVWASLAALEEEHMAAAGMEAAPGQLPPPDAHAAISEQAHVAFASFDAMLVEELPQQWAVSPSLVPIEAERPKQEAHDHTASRSTPLTLEQAQPSGQAAVSSAGEGHAAELAAERSWGEGWADSLLDVPGGQPDQAAWAKEPGSSWKARQRADVALEQALGCDRQAALLCLVQVGSSLPRCGSLTKSCCGPGHWMKHNPQAAEDRGDHTDCAAL